MNVRRGECLLAHAAGFFRDLFDCGEVCPHCRSNATIVIKVEELKEKKGKKGQFEKKERAQLVYPGEALADFKEVFGWK